MKKNNKKDSAPLSRRAFIGKSAVAAAGFAFASQYSYWSSRYIEKPGKAQFKVQRYTNRRHFLFVPKYAMQRGTIAEVLHRL